MKRLMHDIKDVLGRLKFAAKDSHYTWKAFFHDTVDIILPSEKHDRKVRQFLAQTHL